MFKLTCIQKQCNTFFVPTEANKSVSYFHQKTVGVPTSSNRNLLGTDDHLQGRNPHKHQIHQLCLCLLSSALICVCTSGSSAVMKPLCSSFNLFTIWIRHLSLGWEKRKQSSQVGVNHISQAYRIFFYIYKDFTLFAGDEAFLRVSSRTVFRVSRLDRTKDLHSSLSAPHISSNTRYAFFCMPGSLAWTQTQ